MTVPAWNPTPMTSGNFHKRSKHNRICINVNNKNACIQEYIQLQMTSGNFHKRSKHNRVWCINFNNKNACIQEYIQLQLQWYKDIYGNMMMAVQDIHTVLMTRVWHKSIFSIMETCPLNSALIISTYRLLMLIPPGPSVWQSWVNNIFRLRAQTVVTDRYWQTLTTWSSHS